jgi:hypothetical protein
MIARPRGNNWFAYRQGDSGEPMRPARPGVHGAGQHLDGVLATLIRAGQLIAAELATFLPAPRPASAGRARPARADGSPALRPSLPGCPEPP